MDNARVFISHSHKDRIIADSFVRLLLQIGLNTENIVCSSSELTQLQTGVPLFAFLRTILSDDKTIAIFLLSNNYYSSTICLNEMGAIWINQIESYCMFLPGFSVDSIDGVICENPRIGICLTDINSIRKRMFNLCTKIFERFHLSLDNDAFESGLVSFCNDVNEYQASLQDNRLDMRDVSGFCIDSTDSDGCRIWKRGSSERKTMVIVDFSLTSSNLCSVSYRAIVNDWVSYIKCGKQICFEIYSDVKRFQAEIEIHYAVHNESFSFLVSEDVQRYCISPKQFTTYIDDWKMVKEVCFLFRRKELTQKATIVIENLRLE